MEQLLPQQQCELHFVKLWMGEHRVQYNNIICALLQRVFLIGIEFSQCLYTDGNSCYCNRNSLEFRLLQVRGARKPHRWPCNFFFSTKGPVYFSLKTSAIFCCTHIVLRKKNIFVEVKGLVTALKRSMKCRQVEEI